MTREGTGVEWEGGRLSAFGCAWGNETEREAMGSVAPHQASQLRHYTPTPTSLLHAQRTIVQLSAPRPEE